MQSTIGSWQNGHSSVFFLIHNIHNPSSPQFPKDSHSLHLKNSFSLLSLLSKLLKNVSDIYLSFIPTKAAPPYEWNCYHWS